MIEPQYLYSRLTPKTVSELVMCHYDISMINSSVFYVFGLHDNYLIQTDDEKYFVRIYRGDWRSADEINFELDLLNYLKGKDQPISSPIRTKQHGLSFEFNCPEGKRLGAVFSYAAGEPLAQEIAKHEAQRLGRCIANIHKQTKDFNSVYERTKLDSALLVKRSLRVIEPFLTTQQKCYLDSVQKNGCG